MTEEPKEAMTPRQKEAAKERIMPILELLVHIKKQELEISRMLLEVGRWEVEDTVAEVNRQMDRVHDFYRAFGLDGTQEMLRRIEDILYNLSGDILLDKPRAGFGMRHSQRRKREREKANEL